MRLCTLNKQNYINVHCLEDLVRAGPWIRTGLTVLLVNSTDTIQFQALSLK